MGVRGVSPGDDDAAIRDSEPRASALPLHLRPVFILLVGVGGALGTLARYGVGLAIPQSWQLPWPTLTVNLLGAFLLGALIEGLTRRGHDGGRRRAMRLLIGTGFMGGFTTYSSLAVETERLFAAGSRGTAVAYVAASLAAGLVACVVGVAAGSLRVRRRIRDRTAVGR